MSSEEIDTRSRILSATWQLLELNKGKGLSMGAVAKASGISRQAVYLHFASRTELMIATMHYVDEVKGLQQRLAQFESAGSGAELVELCVEVWGNYIPEIYSMARAMMLNRDADEAMAAAWNEGMQCLREVCRQAIDMLESEGKLAQEWQADVATDLLWSLISINQWEQLTIDCGWSQSDYITHMKALAKRVIIA